MVFAPQQRLAYCQPGFGVGLGYITDLQFPDFAGRIYPGDIDGPGHFEMNAGADEPNFARGFIDGIAEMLDYRLLIRINNDNAA